MDRPRRFWDDNRARRPLALLRRELPRSDPDLIKRGHAVDFDASKASLKLKKYSGSASREFALSRPPTILDHYAVGYATPLHLAAYNGNIERLTCCWARGDASIKRPLAMTPRAAAAAGHARCARAAWRRRGSELALRGPPAPGRPRGTGRHARGPRPRG